MSETEFEQEMKAMELRVEREMMIHHKGDVPWHKAPLPRRLHRCSPQTVGARDMVSRCACGAIAHGLSGWMEKNSRRGPWWKLGRGAR